jgi:hypothetical protein
MPALEAGTVKTKTDKTDYFAHGILGIHLSA